MLAIFAQKKESPWHNLARFHGFILILLGLKRKFIRNTRTQTSPQELSSFTSSSSSEIISPLDTPLPRKRPPVPMSRDSKTNRESSRKHVHFDTPNVKNTENFGKRRGRTCIP